MMMMMMMTDNELHRETSNTVYLHSTYQQVAGSIPGRSTAGQQPWTSSYTAR